MNTQEQSGLHKDILYYLNNEKVSLIPVRDKPEITKSGREYAPKTPFYGWKLYQKEIINEKELDFQMLRAKTTAIGMVGGAVSGNLEIIDIDVKNWEGIDVRLFEDIRDFMPDFWDVIRIHRTPSGGSHIPYKISDHEAEGSLKLCWKEGEKQAAIETKGEGGYVLVNPSANYSVIKDNPIPIITWEQRNRLIAICRGYNERVKTDIIVTTKVQNDYYDENPFQHFNGSIEAEQLPLAYGWKLEGQNSNFIWFTRPGKDRGVGMSFNRGKRVFFMFTSSTEFEPDRGYNPSTVLSILAHAGDRKKTFAYLVEKGYGKVKEKVEQRLTKKLALKGKEIPKNFSLEAKKEHQEIVQKIEEDNPHGTFLELKEEKFEVSRERFLWVANGLNFRYFEGELVRIEGRKVSKVSERQFQDTIKSYIVEEDPEIYVLMCDAIEAFFQKNGSFMISRLEILDETKILNDCKNTAYKFYNNGFLKITKDDITFSDYDAFDMLVWDYKIQDRDYSNYKGGRFVDFIEKSVLNYKNIKPVLGYLAHEYKDETMGYIIVFTEACSDPKMGGGSGKNVLCNLLKLTTTYTSKPGSQAKFDEKFFQSWNGQRIFGISDVPKNFDFEFLKEPSTGSFIWKKLFKDEIEVPVEKAPKFIIQTNFSFEITDGGLKRRIKPIEFTDFFTRAGGIDVHYGKHFPNDWSIEDYAGFDTYIAESIQEWLKDGRKLGNYQLSDAGKLKQWQHTYGQISTDFITSNMERFISMEYISNEDFASDWLKYLNENNVSISYRPSMRRLNAALKDYCELMDIVYEYDLAYRKEAVPGYMNLKINSKRKRFASKLEDAPF